MEQWKTIDGWDGYEVSSAGRVRSFKKCRARPDEPLPRILRGYFLPSGYHVTRLKDKGRSRNCYVHNLVMEAFVGPMPDGKQVAHGNGNQSDNRLSNLRYDTPKTRTHNRGGANYTAKLTKKQAADLFLFKGSIQQAASKFGVSYRIAYNIKTRRSYRNATEGL